MKPKQSSTEEVTAGLIPSTMKICANCKKRFVEHRLVNFSDGNVITETMLICPTAIYKDSE